jgi:thioredoxin reductase (NADPH)
MTPLPPETPDQNGAYPRLGEEQILALSAAGDRRPTRDGELLFREGDDPYDFYVVLAGRVSTTQGAPPEERLIAVHGPGRFLGELGLLTHQPALVTATVVQTGEVLRMAAEQVREIVSQDPSFGDLVMRAFLQRREILIDAGGGLRVVGSCYSRDTRRLLEFLARNRIPHRWIDLEEDAAAEELLRALGLAPEETPVVVWGAEVLRNPTNAELARALHVAEPAADGAVCDLVVVGAGPAGLAAAVYGASEGLGTIALEGVAVGGQAGTSSRIENYLGFPAGLSGAELTERARLQAEKFGAQLSIPAEAVALRAEDGHHVVQLDDGSSLAAHTVVVATGSRYRRLPVEAIDRFEGTSVFYAATPVEARVCAGDPVAVVGGGNSAGQAALFLARHAAAVRLIVRDPSLEVHMSRYLADRIERSPAIEVLLDTEVRELVGDEVLEAVVVEDAESGERREIPARALFVFIGAKPHSDWLEGELALDAKGFVLTGRDTAAAWSDGDRVPLLLETSRPGVMAAGDVRSGSIKRVASAVGEGSMAISLVHQHLAGQRGTRLAAQTTGQTNFWST